MGAPVCAGARCQVMDPALQKHTDSGPIVAALYSPRYLSIFVAMGRSVSVWSALTGSLLRLYRDISEYDITFFVIDSCQRRFIVGFTDGCVKVGKWVIICCTSHSCLLPALFRRAWSGVPMLY